MNLKSETRAGLASVALCFPKRWMPNAYWQKHHSEMVANAEASILGRIWNTPPGEAPLLFDEMMQPYLQDPFRGVINRRWLQPGEKPLGIEVEAAQNAIAAAGLHSDDIDLAIVGSFFPNELHTGNAAYLAQALELKGGAFNLESACSSSVVGLQTAMALVDAKQYDRILVVNSCSYSRFAGETDSLSWANGDGASAMVVTRSARNGKWLGGHTHHTGETCGALSVEAVIENDKAVLRMSGNRKTGKLLRESARRFVEIPVHKALKKAKMTLQDFDFFICNTPTAWYRDFFCRVLEIPVDKSISMHADFANTGPVLMPTNLFHALHQKRILPGQRVLLFSVGSVSSASCALLEMGDVGLGPLPPSIPEALVPGERIP